MAPRRSRFTRRQRRLLRLTRTVVVTLSLVGGGIWWAQDEEPSGPPIAAPAAHGAGAEAPAAPAGPDEKSQAQPRPTASATRKAQPRPGAPATPKTRPTPPVDPLPAPLARSRPTGLAVPAITIEAPVLGLGLDSSGRLGTPPADDPRIVGWYKDGPAPGERGTAIVVGHRDTRTGPAIFLNLDSLTPGNTVRVARADGRVAVFTVDKVRTYTKEQFPDREVYGSTGRPELRLLTCGGSFHPKTGYESNIVVYAHLTDIARGV
ncbi:class F sortase [Streptomyces sp. NBC_01353]|uniref:class F sortase n=1 Tax=Streptomyces sp. NBC_01353 TaxID=2903835 RepID=UPI002E317515|nr:class F sortase [Streptomyces sp. NBC_01353]